MSRGLGDVYKRQSPVKLESFNWEGDVPLHLPYNDCVFYKLNVRGFTKSRSSKVKAKGTFRGIVEKYHILRNLVLLRLNLCRHMNLMRHTDFLNS